MLELKIVEHCAPTLAGLKTANLFKYRVDSFDVFWEEFRTESRKLARKGVLMKVMRMSQTGVLLYVYRKSRLEADLKKAGAAELLERYGYQNTEAEACISHLRTRLCSYESFPHEIGLFLSYPLEDVIGFIENGGKNCKYAGIWKVYANECETIKLFARFEKCRDIYVRLFKNGRSITQLTIAA